MYFLTVNAGSSSIKFCLFEADTLKQISCGTIAGIGFEHGSFSASNKPGGRQEVIVADHQAALALLQEWLAQQFSLDDISAVGYRIVHGGPKYFDSCLVNDQLIGDLRSFVPLDPSHLPVQIDIIETLRQQLPAAQHVACFDTAFFHDLPVTARLLPLPRKYEADGIRRYGFHGLSYRFLMQEFERLAGAEAARGKIVMAHLGNGASLAAIDNGQPVDTTMSFTPFGGIPMSTRSGDLDPGLVSYLARTYHLTAEQFDKLVGFESGLLGISETTPDMKQLLDSERDDSRAKDAVDIFCYHVKKTIGAYKAAMGGLNSLIFSGGIGEVASDIRARICDGLDSLGIVLDDDRNQANAELISADGHPVGVHVLATNEAASIAQDVSNIIKGNG